MDAFKFNTLGQWILEKKATPPPLPSIKSTTMPPPLPGAKKPAMPPPLPQEKTVVTPPPLPQPAQPAVSAAPASATGNKVIIGARANELYHPYMHHNDLNHDWDAYYAGNGRYTHDPHSAMSFPSHEEAKNILQNEYAKHGKTMIHPDVHQSFAFDPNEIGTVEKSNYGPKGTGMYDPAVNAKRKAKNVDTVEGVGPNRSIKTYTSSPTGMSAREMASKEAQSYNKLNRKQPVKRYTPAELEQYKQNKMKIAKNGQWSLE